MSSICSSRFPIPCACRAIALSLVALALGSPAAAQRDEGVVDELARLLAAGRIGDPQAVDPLVAALAASGQGERIRSIHR